MISKSLYVIKDLMSLRIYERKPEGDYIIVNTPAAARILIDKITSDLTSLRWIRLEKEELGTFKWRYLRILKEI